MSPASNPYAPPKHEHAAPVVTAEAAALEAFRREHLNAETNIKTIGFLLYLGALGAVSSSLSRLTTDPAGGLLLVAEAAALGWAGYWLRRLDPRGRTLYSVIAALLIVVTLAVSSDNSTGATLGSLFWVMVLVALLWWGKAGVVMSSHYREVVVPATPHIKYKTSPLVLVLGLLLIVVLMLAVWGL
jgi:hypothetical protein